MLPRVPSLITPFLVLTVVTGCAAGSDYPSLAPRPIEEVSLAEPVPRAVPAVTPDAVAVARYDPLVAKARTGDQAFRTRLADARTTLRAGREAAAGSDAWVAAQQALSRLQGSRTAVVEALAALQAASEACDTRSDRGLAEAANRALETVRAIDAAEAQALAKAAPSAS